MYVCSTTVAPFVFVTTGVSAWVPGARSVRPALVRRFDRGQRAALIGDGAVDPVGASAVDHLGDHVIEEERRGEFLGRAGAGSAVLTSAG